MVKIETLKKVFDLLGEVILITSPVILYGCQNEVCGNTKNARIEQFKAPLVRNVQINFRKKYWA